MKIRFVLPILIIAGILWFSPISSFADSTPIFNSNGYGNIQIPADIDYEYQPEPGDEYGLAITDFVYERDPAIAHCSEPNKYLVVYEKNGDIYGQRLYDWGQSQGNAFLISNGSANSLNPDVACDVWNNFLVVWQHEFDDNYIIRARLIAGTQQSGAQLLGNEITVADDEWKEVRSPAVACNWVALTCLVVYERSYPDSAEGVHGQRVAISSSSISTEGDTIDFKIVDAIQDTDANPDVAWGLQDNVYMVVWSYYNPVVEVKTIYNIAVHDRLQGSGEQFVFFPPHYLGGFPGDSTNPSIAASTDANTDDRFLVAWEHSGNIIGRHLNSIQPFGWDAFGISVEIPTDSQPVVAYSGGRQGESLGNYLDQYLVAFYRQYGNERKVMVQGIEGSYDAANVGHRHHIGVAREIASSSLPTFLDFGPFDVVGSSKNGRYLVAWENMVNGFSPDRDIYGQFVYPDCFSLEKILNPECPNCSIWAEQPRCLDDTLYPYGDTVSLVAYPYGDYFFTHWSGDISGTFPNKIIRMDENLSVTANFAETVTCYSLTTGVTPGGSGSVNADPTPNCNGETQYRDGTNVTLTGVPTTGYTFDRWSGSISSYENPRVVTMNGDKSIMANFVATTTCYTLITAANPISGGSIEVDPDPNCTGGQYTENTIISLAADPNAGYAFSDWEGDASGISTPIQVEMSASKAITATFENVGLKNVLIDEAHDNQLSLDEIRAQEIETGTPWNDDWTWFYLDQMKTLLADKYTLLNDPSNPLTYEQLMSYEALVIPHYYQTMTPDEVEAIKKYVANGGGVVILGDCGNEPLNPELNQAYWIEILPECVFMPYDEAQGLDGDVAVENIWFGTNSPEVNTFTMNWGQSVGILGEGLWIADTWAEDYETWRDDNGNDIYDPGEEGIFGVVVGHDTGCGRVAALGDNTFSDGALDWTANDSIFEALLDWVTDGYPCPVNQQKVLVDEYHDNHLTLDHSRAQEIVDGQGWGDPETYRLNIMSTKLINDFAFENNPGSPLIDTLLANYEALIIPWYFEPLSPSEVEAVEDFVATGGGLILIGDCAFSNPNPELAANYDLEFMPECLFAPVPQFEGAISNFSYSGNPPILRDAAYYTQNWGQWLQPNYANGEVFWLLDTGGLDTWIDLNWNDQYDSGEEAYIDVVAGYDTGCGRVMAIADDAFGDSNMDWTENDEFLRDILSWVTAGPTCELNSNDIFLPLLMK